MKKTIIIFILLILLTSCNKEVSNIQPEKILTSNQTEIVEQVEKLQEIQKTEETIEQKKELENRKEKLDDLLWEYEKLSNINKSKLECESLYIINENSTISEKILAKNMISKCNNIKYIAIIEIQKLSKNFEITNCEASIKDKYKNKDISEQFITSETERCEMSYALRTWCENFTDTNKKAYCEELKEFQKKQYLIESAKNFEIWEYLR